MKKIFVLFGILCLIGLASAAIYQAPWIQNQLGDSYNLTDMGWIIADYFNGSFVGEFAGDINWTSLQNYPVACPGSGAITNLGDVVTCSDLWLDVAGDTLTGNLNAGTNNITNLTFVNTTILAADTIIGTVNNTAFANVSFFWDELDSPSDLNNLVTIQGENISGGTIDFARLPTLTNMLTLDWANITNKFITAVDGIYIYMSGTTATFNETKLNFSIEAYGYSTEVGTVTSVATDDTYLTGGAITTTGTITFSTALAGTDLAVNSSDYWDNLGSPSDINAGDITDDGTYLPLAGGTMVGIINMGSDNITAVECIVFDSGGSICTGV